MKPNHSRRKEFKERTTDPPSSVWALAVSRLPDEQERGYDSLSLLLLLFESVLDLRLATQSAASEEEPWIVYRRKMDKAQGQTIECFELPLNKKLTKPSPVIAVSTVSTFEDCIVAGTLP